MLDRRLSRKSSAPPATGIYYDQRKSLQYSEYHVGDRQGPRIAAPLRFTSGGETKSLHAPAAPFSGRPRPAPPPPPPAGHQGPSSYLHGGRPGAGPLLYHAIDSGLVGADSSYVEHIYESPTCGRRDFDTQRGGGGGGAADSLQYFEIESERRPNGQESL